MSTMSVVPHFFTRDNPLFATYAFYTGVLTLKMFTLSSLTTHHRIKKKAFCNPEDVKSPGNKIDLADPDVERVRRAHLNDLENIPAFLFVSYLYILTSPQPSLALNLFRAYTAARVTYSVAYAVVPLPRARGLSYSVGLGVTTFMAFKVIKHFCRSC